MHSLSHFFKDPRVFIFLSILLSMVFLIIAAPFFTGHDPTLSDLSKRLCDRSAEHFLGCDLDGGDVWTNILYGGRATLLISGVTVFLCLSVGLIVGLLSGFYGGFLDFILMRVVDLLMAFPGILMAMLLAAFLGPSKKNVIFAICATGWISTARLVRAQVLSLKERTFVMSARAVGASNLRTIFKHILPSLFAPLIILSTFSLSGVIIIESSLSFLGLGSLEAPLTWGALLSQGKSVLIEAPLLSVVPGIAILLIVLSLNALGDACQDYFDPKKTN